MAFELMNTQEIHEFGLQVLLQHLTEKGFEIEFAQPNKSEFQSAEVSIKLCIFKSFGT